MLVEQAWRGSAVDFGDGNAMVLQVDALVISSISPLMGVRLLGSLTLLASLTTFGFVGCKPLKAKVKPSNALVSPLNLSEGNSSRCFLSLKRISGLPGLATNTLLIGFRYL